MARKWTFMVYMAGYNDLSPFASKDLEEMRTVGSTEDVTVAVFLKQLSEKSAYRVIVGKDGSGEDQERLGAADSGSPQTLLDFVRWATEKAPADKYALVVWNHGSGWQPDDLDDLYAQVRGARGGTGVTPRELGVRSNQQIARSLFDTTVKEVLALSNSGERAIASDDGTGHSLDTIELTRVLERAHAELGQPFELLGMDACLMSNLEVAYEAKDHVKFVVGSEELEPGDGWPYHRILASLAADPDMDGGALGGSIVQHYIESYRDRRDQWPVTQCAVTTEGLGAFADAFDRLASTLQAQVNDEVAAAKVMRAQSRSARFAGELVDLKTFCDNLSAASGDDTINEAARGVVDALAPGTYVVAESHLGPTVEGCGGVTAYFPPPTEPVSRFYGDLRFARERTWDDFLVGYGRALRGE
ncbi:MAG TPA: clostripain-related cysteine peptidase [Acidimicrobiales bacterium]|nr:clostripain-related cysteine peptidase [Acidimicrobiales bacterium]